jgi:hypothetical protein
MNVYSVTLMVRSVILVDYFDGYHIMKTLKIKIIIVGFFI